MSARNGLIPVLTVDKNGRTTTVHVRPDNAKHRVTLPPVSLPPAPVVAATDESKLIDSYVKRIQKSFAKAGGEKFSVHQKLDVEHLRLIAELSECKHADEDMSFIIQSRVNPLGEEPLQQWLEVMTRHFDDVMESRALADRRFAGRQAAELIGALPRVKFLECLLRGMSYAEYKERGEDEFTPEQELHLVLLNAAALSSPLEGKRQFANGMHGPTKYVDNRGLIEFAFNGATREQVDTACEIIRSGSVTRFDEVQAVLDKETVSAVAEGWL